MCNHLFQYYACGHPKVICITPCPRALETGKRIPINKSGTDLSRSVSNVSSISSSVRRHDITDLPNQLRSPRSPPSYTGSSRVPSAPAVPLRSSISPAHTPATIGPAPAVTVTRWSIHNPDPPRPASPDLSPTPALPDEDFTIEPNFCGYHFKRDLPQSNHPCIECYFLPKWAHLADRYVKSYREGHPLNRPEEAEKISGIERMRDEFRVKAGQEQGQGQGDVGRKGLLNVFVYGDGEAGRAV